VPRYPQHKNHYTIFSRAAVAFVINYLILFCVFIVLLCFDDVEGEEELSGKSSFEDFE